MDNNADKYAIIITEYPKSGGTWLTAMIGDSLNIPIRDIYVTDERVNDPNNKYFEPVRRYSWYEGATTVNAIPPCAVKSHELPNSPIITFNAKYIHLVRDGRDVAVSRYFFEKDFCVKNDLIDDFDVPFEEYIIKIAHEWVNYVNLWIEQDVPYVTYESLLSNTMRTLKKIFNDLGVKPTKDKIKTAILKNEKSQFSANFAPIFKYNTFVRKCIIGDWKNHFNEKHEKLFNDIAGETLIKLGYIKWPKFYKAYRKIKYIKNFIKNRNYYATDSTK